MFNCDYWFIGFVLLQKEYPKRILYVFNSPYPTLRLALLTIASILSRKASVIDCLIVWSICDDINEYLVDELNNKKARYPIQHLEFHSIHYWVS